MLMLISLAFALRHKHNIGTRRTNNVRYSCAYVVLMSWVFSLAYASVCAYAYACAYAPVKTSLNYQINVNLATSLHFDAKGE